MERRFDPLAPTVVNPCASSTLDKTTKRHGSAITVAVRQKQTGIGARYPTHLHPTFAACVDVGVPGLDTQALVKAMLVRGVDLRDNAHTDWAHAAERKFKKWHTGAAGSLLYWGKRSLSASDIAG